MRTVELNTKYNDCSTTIYILKGGGGGGGGANRQGGPISANKLVPGITNLAAVFVSGGLFCGRGGGGGGKIRYDNTLFCCPTSIKETPA